jgi:hypothetical protein
MQTQIFVLCDKFVLGKTPDGQMVWSIVGPLDTRKPAQFPARIRVTVVAALRFLAEEHGGHQIEISLIDADSRPLIEPTTGKPVGIAKRITVPDTNRSHCHFEVWSLGHPGGVADPGGALFEQPGEYYFDLRVNGTHFGRLPLRILPVS